MTIARLMRTTSTPVEKGLFGKTCEGDMGTRRARTGTAAELAGRQAWEEQCWCWEAQRGCGGEQNGGDGIMHSRAVMCAAEELSSGSAVQQQDHCGSGNGP